MEVSGEGAIMETVAVLLVGVGVIALVVLGIIFVVAVGWFFSSSV